MELLECIATLPGGSGQWNSCNALPHCLGALGSATPAMHCLTVWVQWAVELLPPPPPLLTRACPNTETLCFRTFGPFFELFFFAVLIQ